MARPRVHGDAGELDVADHLGELVLTSSRSARAPTHRRSHVRDGRYALSHMHVCNRYEVGGPLVARQAEVLFVCVYVRGLGRT